MHPDRLCDTCKAEAKYNGWANRPTWLVNLWLMNDEVLYEMLRNVMYGGPLTAEQLERFVTEEIRYRTLALAESELFVQDLAIDLLYLVDWDELVAACNDDFAYLWKDSEEKGDG
jgi:hypothetical protein